MDSLTTLAGALAYAMAAKSKYREILSHYYQGVEFTFLF